MNTFHEKEPMNSVMKYGIGKYGAWQSEGGKAGL
jgi:hypothetical protein